MANVRSNFNRARNPREDALKFAAEQRSAKRRVFWDKNAHGISLCAGVDWEQEAARHPLRLIPINSDADVDEVFRHYEVNE
jgi:hypothetical protein